MRDHILAIINYARNARGNNNERTEQLLSEIETEAMAALHGGVYLIPSKLFGEITIPQNVIIDMGNGGDDLWFSVDKYINVNLFYVPDGWQFNMYPVKNGHINTDTELEKGKL